MMYGIGTAELIVVAIVFGLFILLPACIIGLVVWLVVRKSQGQPAALCPQCGTPTGPGANYCAHCGQRL